MEAQIKAAIAAYLDRETVVAKKLAGGETTRHFMSEPSKGCNELACEIYAAIKPHLPAQESWEDAPDWAEWRTVDYTGRIDYWQHEPFDLFENGNFSMGEYGRRFTGGKIDMIKKEQRPKC